MEQPDELKILVIDDDQDTRERLESVLKRRGHSVLVAANGLEGLELIKKNAVDVIFSDIVMPKMDGLEFLLKIHEQTPRTELIIMTGLPSVEWITESLDKNTVEFMSKPLTIDDVLNSLNRAKKRLQEKKESPISNQFSPYD